VRFVVKLLSGGVAATHSLDSTDARWTLNLDFSPSGRILGVELLGASSLLSPELLATALGPVRATSFLTVFVRTRRSKALRVELDCAADIARVHLGHRAESDVRIVEGISLPSAGRIEFEYATSGHILAIVVHTASQLLPLPMLRSLNS